MTTNNLTPFGKLVRIMRLENNIKSKDMAIGLDVSVAYLSAVETGKKKLTDLFTEKVASYFTKTLSNTDLKPLYEAADKSKTEFTITVGKGTADESRELVAQFARKFPSLTNDTEATNKLLKFLQEID